jgi:uncharacterized protein YrrD
VRRAEELLNLPVRVRGIELGRAVDLILDRAGSRVVGFDVRCGDRQHRFLPFAVARLLADAVESDSPLVLLDFDQVSFYRDRGTTFRALAETDDLMIDVQGRLEGPVAAERRW